MASAAAAVLVLALAGCCVGQRKVSRTVPVAADVKREVNFDCPEEFGYYPHPSDCTQYYVCVFGGALLESCTGGLMYSHELQTCDWPRNVGCDGLELSGPPPSASSTSGSSSRSRDRAERERERDRAERIIEKEETRARYSPPPPPPPPQPKAIVTSRGQPRQLQHKQEIIKQQHQQQLYADADEALPPAEEIESDRQQRVYRGQPSTVGQVQRDRDGLRHTNAIPSPYSSRGEKIGVINFGTQNNNHYSISTDIDDILTNDITIKRRRKRQTRGSEESSVTPQASISTATATARTLYNSSQYNNKVYEPYYALYDDEPEQLYRDIDYPQQNNYNTNTGGSRGSSSYRRTPAVVTQSTETPKRGNSVYYNQDIYSQSTAADYAEDNSYQDDGNYRPSSRQPSRGDRNEINDIEEAPIKRTTTRKTTTTPRTTTTQPPRSIPPKKSTVPASSPPVTANENQTQALSINTNPEDPGYTTDIPPSLPLYQHSSQISGQRLDIPTTLPITYRPRFSTTTATTSTTTPNYNSLHDKPSGDAVLQKPAPFSQLQTLDTQRPAFHFITKAPKSDTTTHLVSSTVDSGNDNTKSSTNVNNQHQVSHDTHYAHKSKIIVPTTYSPPKFFLKAILHKPIAPLNESPSFSFKPLNKSESYSVHKTGSSVGISEYSLSKPTKTLKAVRKLINPITVNHELTTTVSSYESAEKIASKINFDDDSIEQESNYSGTYDNDPETLDFIEESAEDSLEESVEAKVPIKSTQYRIGKPAKIDSKLSDSHVSPTTTKLSTFKPSSSSSTTSTVTTTTTAKAKAPLKLSTRLNIGSPTSYLKGRHRKNKTDRQYSTEKLLRYFVEPDHKNDTALTEKRFRNTVEIPPAHEIVYSEEKAKDEPDQPPAYKPKPNPKPLVPLTETKTDIPLNSSHPSRVSRIKAAIKSLIAVGGTRGQNSKCSESSSNPNCKTEKKQRTASRGRGSVSYSGTGQVLSNEVTVNTNRGTPPPRSRPTLKPTTAILSKASEYFDIYRFPPRRPSPIYPQPQPDKTAAKCRKDVCLLPDCSCGGKEIPGDLPVEQVPQIVLLTFDDSVNDLNKGLYQDLFEKGRTNPNGCPIAATFYVSHEWTDYSQVQNLYSDGHELASHTVSHSFGEQFSQKKWTREVAGQREILAAYGGVRLEDVRGMRAPFLSVGGNKMFKMLYDSNFTYDSSMPIYENKPPSWPYTLDYKLFHDCMIPPCPTRSYPGVWEVPMVMWQDLNGGRCSMGDACSNPPDADGVYKMLMKNFQRHYTTNRAPFGLFYHAAWFTQPHHKEGFINFVDTVLRMQDVWFLTNWQAIQWVRDPTPTSRLASFKPFQCDFSNRPKRCNNPKVCNLWHKSGVRYMRTCQPCPDIYPWTGNTGIRSSKIDNDIED